jgi:hypothetical protein
MANTPENAFTSNTNVDGSIQIPKLRFLDNYVDRAMLDNQINPDRQNEHPGR